MGSCISRQRNGAHKTDKSVFTLSVKKNVDLVEPAIILMNKQNIDQTDVTSKRVSKPSKRIHKITLPLAPSIQQNFSLPDSIIYYMAKNPTTPKCYSKMIQSCKYFFLKNPIIVVGHICNNGKHLYSNRGYYEYCVYFDINKLSSKLWLTDYQNISDIPSPYSVYTTKFYRFNNAQLTLRSMTITIKDFQLIATKFEKFYFWNSKIIDDDGNVVLLDKILGCIPNVIEFDYPIDFQRSPFVSASTMKNINKLTNLGNLRKIELHQIPEIIDVEDLAQFIKNHKDTKIFLNFASQLSQEYKNQLDHLIDTIIASGVSNGEINYDGQYQQKRGIMCHHHAQINTELRYGAVHKLRYCGL